MNYKNLINKLKRNKKIIEVENALTIEEEGSLRTKLESNLKYIYTMTEATELPIEFNFHHEPTKSSKEARLYLKTCLEDLGYDRALIADRSVSNSSVVNWCIVIEDNEDY